MSITSLIESFYHQVWNTSDHDRAREILHLDFDFRGSLGPVHKGPEGFIQYMKDLQAGLPDFRCDIVDIIAQDNKAAARMAFSGTHGGPFYGVPGTQKRIQWSGAAFFQSDGHQLTALWVLGDIDAVKKQLGLDAGPDFAAD